MINFSSKAFLGNEVFMTNFFSPKDFRAIFGRDSRTSNSSREALNS
jgi:hypothetical protein